LPENTLNLLPEVFVVDPLVPQDRELVHEVAKCHEHRVLVQAKRSRELEIIGRSLVQDIIFIE